MANLITVTKEYIKSSVAELKKVTWPTKDMTMRYSALVIIVSIAVAAFFASLDFGFSRLVTQVLAKAATGEQAATQPEAEGTVVPDLEPNTLESQPENPGINVEAETLNGEPIQVNPSETSGDLQLPVSE